MEAEKASWYVSANTDTSPSHCLERMFIQIESSENRGQWHNQVLESQKLLLLGGRTWFSFCFRMSKKKIKFFLNMHTHAAELKVFIIPVKVINN